MVLMRYFAVISLCLCILFSSSCTKNNDDYVDHSQRDKAILIADTICDDESHIYFTRERDRKVFKIDKSTLAVEETGLNAFRISVYDGVLYRTNKTVFYKDDTAIGLPMNDFPGTYAFVVDNFGFWVIKSMHEVSHMSSDPDDLTTWEEMQNRFPVVDNKGNAHFCDAKPVGDYYYYVIDGITVHRTHGSYMEYNSGFHIYDNHLYFKDGNVKDGQVISVVSLQTGRRFQKPYNVDHILAVGHNTIYFRVDDQIMKEDLTSGKLMECASSLPKTAECYVDSYRDIVYIIDSDDDGIECSIATFNELAS